VKYSLNDGGQIVYKLFYISFLLVDYVQDHLRPRKDTCGLPTCFLSTSVYHKSPNVNIFKA